MGKVRYNKSKTYLLPLLSELVGFQKKFYKNLVNTYIFDDLGKYKDCIMIQHDFSFKTPEYTKYEHEITNNEYFVDLIDMNDQVLYIFKFPEEYMHEYNQFKLGKYSKYKKDGKELILDFYSNIYKYNPNAINFLLEVKQILFKDEKLKRKIEKDLKVSISNDAELTDIMKEENETFNISKYIYTKDDKDKDKEIRS